MVNPGDAKQCDELVADRGGFPSPEALARGSQGCPPLKLPVRDDDGANSCRYVVDFVGSIFCAAVSPEPILRSSGIVYGPVAVVSSGAAGAPVSAPGESSANDHWSTCSQTSVMSRSNL